MIIHIVKASLKDSPRILLKGLAPLVHVSVCVQIINYLTGSPEMQVENQWGKGENVQEAEEYPTDT